MKPEETTEFSSVNTVTRIVAERQRNWGSIPSRKRFNFSGSRPLPYFWVAAILSWVYSSWCLHMTSQFHVVRSSRIYNTTPLYESIPWCWPLTLYS